MPRKKPLSYYLALKYPFRADVDETGEYVVTFPDLRGCFTGAEELENLPAMIKEGSSLWLESMYAGDLAMPEPTLLDLDEPSGKFNVRLPKGLHRALTEGADLQGVSLNQYVVALLSRGDAQARIEQRLSDLEAAVAGGCAGSAMVAEEKAVYVAAPRTRRAPKKTSSRAKRARS